MYPVHGRSKGDTVEGITVERASELLAERRSKGPATGRRGAGRTKKAAAKKSPAKKKSAAKKTAAKKTAAKKTAAKRTAARTTAAEQAVRPGSTTPAGSCGAGDVAGVRGRFISLDGVDGCGKTTHATRLADRPRTVSPGSRAGQRSVGTLRALVLGAGRPGMSARAEALLYAADRRSTPRDSDPGVSAGRHVGRTGRGRRAWRTRATVADLDVAVVEPDVDRWRPTACCPTS